MEYGGQAFAGAPYAGAPADFAVLLNLQIIFPVSFVFYGEVGDIIFIPPDIDVDPTNMNERRSPCVRYDNEDM